MKGQMTRTPQMRDLSLLLSLESKILQDRVKKLGFVPDFVDFPWEPLIHWEECRRGVGWGRDGEENCGWNRKLILKK